MWEMCLRSLAERSLASGFLRQKDLESFTPRARAGPQKGQAEEEQQVAQLARRLKAKQGAAQQRKAFLAAAEEEEEGAEVAVEEVEATSLTHRRRLGSF